MALGEVKGTLQPGHAEDAVDLGIELTVRYLLRLGLGPLIRQNPAHETALLRAEFLDATGTETPEHADLTDEGRGKTVAGAVELHEVEAKAVEVHLARFARVFLHVRKSDTPSRDL